MEAEWQADRALLRSLIHSRPDLSLKQIAARIGRSYSWAKKWARRLAEAPPETLDVLHSRSRAARRHRQIGTRWCSIAWSKFACSRRRGSNVSLVRRRFCIICLAMSSYKREDAASLAPHVPFGNCSVDWACSATDQCSRMNRFRCASPWKRCRWTSRTPAPLRLISVAKASNSIS